MVDFLDVDRMYDMLAMNAINQKLEKAQLFVLVSINNLCGIVMIQRDPKYSLSEC